MSAEDAFRARLDDTMALDPLGQTRSLPAVTVHSRWQVALFGLALFAVALAPRWVARDVFVTSAEDAWMRRAGGFAYGISHGLLGRTYQNGQPGVLTMELVILGQWPGGAERFADPVTGARMVTRVPGFFAGLV